MSKELLKRIDERNYLTEREHQEYLRELEKKLDKLAVFEKHTKIFEYEDEYFMRFQFGDTTEKISKKEWEVVK